MDDSLKASHTVGSESDNYSSIIKVRLGEGGRGIDRAKYHFAASLFVRPSEV